MIDDVVIFVESPGLGDHLIFSTLPEMFARRGHRVFVSTRCTFRNDEVKRLLYDENPFVSGWSDAEPNAGTKHGREGSSHDFYFEGKRIRGTIPHIERAHGLPPTNLYPKVYYQPKWRPEFAGKVLADTRSSSQFFSAETFERFIDHIEVPHADLYRIESPHSGPHGVQSLSNQAVIRVADLHEYCDAIYSCKAFCSTEAGGHILASAIVGYNAEPELFAVTTSLNHKCAVFLFPNVTYCVVGNPIREWR